MPANYNHTTRADGSILTGSIYNADHQNHITFGTPGGIDDYSTNLAQMQATVDPGESGTESLPTDLAGEIQRIRNIIKEITGKTYWYESPTFSLLAQALVQNSQSGAYTTVLADGSKHLLHPTADNNPRTFTIDSNANVAYPIGTVITFVNQINVLTIAITSDTMTLAGTASTGSRTLAANGIATALKVASTSWLISGTGLA